MTVWKSFSHVLRLGPGLVFHPFVQNFARRARRRYYLRVELGPRDEVFPRP